MEGMTLLEPLTDHEIDDDCNRIGNRTAPELCPQCTEFLLFRSNGRSSEISYRSRGFPENRLRRNCYFCSKITKAWKLWHNAPLRRMGVHSVNNASMDLYAWDASHRRCRRLELYCTSQGNDIAAYAQSDDIWRTLTDPRPDLSLLPYSERSLVFVKRQLQECLTTHKACRPQPQPWSKEPQRPSRLLFVDPTPDNPCKVVECCAETPYMYCALSYCWGEATFIRSNSDNHAQHKQAIPVSSLPKAFVDAVFICRQLSVCYLWIDSLCILQDDLNDWATESAKMADIYEGALITIGASTSIDPHHSFLSPPGSSFDEQLEIEPEDFARNLPAIKARMRVSLNKAATQPARPLEVRGWALQEKLLATRYISYGEREVEWQCKTLEYCECGSCKADSDTSTVFTKQLMCTPLLTWGSVLSHYTRRLLAREEDKLPAIAGMATRLADMTRFTYFCGLWKENLVDDLCWRTSVASKRRGSGATYRAPSFSWASIDSKIWQNTARKNSTHHITIIQAECKVKTANTFGQVDDAFVVVDGYLLDGTLTSRSSNDIIVVPSHMTSQCCVDSVGWKYFPDTAEPPSSLSTDPKQSYGLSGSIEHNVTASTRERHVDRKDVKCLKIRSYQTSYGGSNIDILVLSSYRRVPGAYERLGLLSSHESDQDNVRRCEHGELNDQIDAWLDTSSMQKTRVKLV